MTRDVHFDLLDAVRGAAALLVVLYHLGHWLGFPTLAANGGLSVDLFFCLSGFVITLAYGSDLPRSLSFGTFVKRRLIRLMPLMVLATVIAASYIAARIGLRRQAEVEGAFTVAILLGIASIPDLNAPAAIGGPQIFPLNGPQYTLFFELFVNGLWFAVRRQVGLQSALAISIAGYVVLLFTGIGGDVPANFLAGFPRVVASFFAGVAICHLRRLESVWFTAPPMRWSFPFAVAAFVCLCLDPRPLQNTESVMATMVVASWMVISGAGWQVRGRASRWSRSLGEISYPIYALQYPIFCWVNGTAARFGYGHGILEAIVCFILIVLSSAMLLSAYDRPLRRWLSSRRRAFVPVVGGQG